MFGICHLFFLGWKSYTENFAQAVFKSFYLMREQKRNIPEPEKATLLSWILNWGH
jgi:hypothetical protein